MREIFFKFNYFKISPDKNNVSIFSVMASSSFYIAESLYSYLDLVQEEKAKGLLDYIKELVSMYSEATVSTASVSV